MFEAKSKKCCKIQHERDISRIETQKSILEDALRNWETQIDQLRMQEHESNNCRVIRTYDKTSKQDLASDNVLPVNTQKEDDIHLKIMPCQLSSNELNPGSFTLPCSIDIFNFYAMTDLGVNINIMPKSMLKKLNLIKIKKTNVLVEMTDMTKRTPLGIVENILVKIDKFYFPFDFVVFDMEAIRNETIILGSPFLATIPAEIDVFAREITLGTEGERVKLSMDNIDYDFASVNEKVYMLKVLLDNNLSNKLTTHEFNYLLDIDSDIFGYDINKKETTNTVQRNVYWCEPIHQERSSGHKLWASCNPYHKACNWGRVA
uniref:Reverse transcriptase domain-containing protein n=1 Tax=Tanacetum cinerariifolium TaxID=118510 RepID=A0A699JD48_TANCI|nr:hypothetical protein [Tanacetum cinerariifolium]